jgi:hypothetical protein
MNPDDTFNKKLAFLYDQDYIHMYLLNEVSQILYAYFDVVAPPISSGIFSCSLCISRAT